jgi:hypothetical protein
MFTCDALLLTAHSMVRTQKWYEPKIDVAPQTSDAKIMPVLAEKIA